jgi:hypothetical protein
VELFDVINSHRYLYLTDMSEPDVNVLRLVVTEGQVRSTDERRAGEASEYGAIVADERCASYEVLFVSYVAYFVRNESFTVHDDTESFVGALFRVYSKSKFLEHVAAATIASVEYGGPFTHYGLVCEDHIVDVAASGEPLISVLRNSKSSLRALESGG